MELPPVPSTIRLTAKMSSLVDMSRKRKIMALSRSSASNDSHDTLPTPNANPSMISLRRPLPRLRTAAGGKTKSPEHKRRMFTAYTISEDVSGNHTETESLLASKPLNDPPYQRGLGMQVAQAVILHCQAY